MSEKLSFTVTGMPASGARDDGRVEMVFTTEQGPQLALTFDAERIDRFAVRAHQGSVLARIQRANKTGHLLLHGEALATVAAEPAVGGSSVLMILHTPKREILPYSLTLAQARKLHGALAGAIAAAEGDAGQTRQ